METAFSQLPQNKCLLELHAFVFPKSKKAKNRFANLMGSIDEVIVEQNKGDEVLVTSLNRKNHFWVNLNNDKDWDIELVLQM